MRLGICQRSAALLATGHDSGVKALLQAGGQIINFMGAVDFDSLARGVEDDHAVAATAEVRLQFDAHLGGHRVVDQVVEMGEKLFASHFFVPVSPDLVSLGLLFLRK